MPPRPSSPSISTASEYVKKLTVYGVAPKARPFVALFVIERTNALPATIRQIRTSRPAAGFDRCYAPGELELETENATAIPVFR